MSDEEMRSLFLESKELLDQLSKRDGSLWKDSTGEMQYQYEEMVVWILLYDDSDVVEVHERLREVMSAKGALFEALECVLLYELITDEGRFGLSLKGNREVFQGLDRDVLPGRWFPTTEKSTPFAAESSRRGA